MVRNLNGGNRHKKQARKNVNEDTIKIKTRLADPDESCEMYATVTRMFGQGNCEVLCNDGKIRLCVIRNKFKGRNKSKNMIMVDTKVLVGLRDWEIVTSEKRQKCDLLEVYDRTQHNDIKRDPRCEWKLIASNIEKDLIEKNEEQPFEFIHSNKSYNIDGTDDVSYSNDNIKDNDDEIDFDAI